MKKSFMAITRAVQFSPNSVSKDRAIMDAVVSRLKENDDYYMLKLISETELTKEDNADLYLSMGRLPETLSILKEKEDNGSAVINSAYGVELCTRSVITSIMRDNNIPMPPLKGDCGYWLKRGDASASSKEDICFCADERELKESLQRFNQRGVTDIVESAHVEGDLIKFYGIEGSDFFRYYYPYEEGVSKYGDEHINGKPNHYGFSEKELRTTVEKLSRIVHTPIYGGDCIVTKEGEYKIIDFNDWPSFSPCVEESASAIVRKITCK